MSFDARSRERLEALGRQLPKPLPLPEPARSETRSDAPRHAVELEQDPEQLFRELMAASADGSVPPHLLERLRELEESRRRLARASVQNISSAPGSARPPQSSPTGAAGGAPKRSNRPSQGETRSSRPRNNRPGNAPPRNAEEESLYTAFQQLLLEGDDDLAD